MVWLLLNTRRDSRRITPPTSNTTVRFGWLMASRSEPAPLSFRFVTCTTSAPRPPFASRPKPCAPGNASTSPPAGGVLGGGTTGAFPGAGVSLGGGVAGGVLAVGGARPPTGTCPSVLGVPDGDGVAAAIGAA